MRPALRTLFFCIAAIALPASALADGGHAGGHSGGHGGGHGGGHRSGAGFHHSGGGSHHHFRSGFAFIGVSPFFYDYPPYFYGAPPYYAPAHQPPAPPTTYIEKFEGVPAPGMTGIVCPSTGLRYPEASECPGGWAHVIESPQPAG